MKHHDHKKGAKKNPNPFEMTLARQVHVSTVAMDAFSSRHEGNLMKSKTYISLYKGK